MGSIKSYSYFQVLFLSILKLKTPMKVLEALRKIAKDQKIDVLARLIFEHWGSEDDADRPSAAKGTGLVHLLHG